MFQYHAYASLVATFPTSDRRRDKIILDTVFYHSILSLAWLIKFIMAKHVINLKASEQLLAGFVRYYIVPIFTVLKNDFRSTIKC